MLVEARQDFEPRRAVVDLMKPAPQKTIFVPRPVPPIIYEGDRDVAEKRIGQKSESTYVPKRKLGKPAIPARRREIGDGGLYDVEKYGAWIPAADALEVAPGSHALHHQHCQPEGQNNQSALHLDPLRQSLWGRD